MKNKIICFIPARSGSKSIINKNLRKINRKTLLEITVEQAIKSKKFYKIIVSSDSQKILNNVKKFKVIRLKRSKRNSSDIASTDNALLETLKYINFDFDSIVILQVTSPLRKVETVKNFVDYCKNKKFDTCCTVTELDEQVGIKKSFFNPLLQRNIRRRQSRKKFIFENSLMYFIKRKFILKNKKIYAKKNWNYFITNRYESLDINNFEDLKMAKLLYKKI